MKVDTYQGNNSYDKKNVENSTEKVYKNLFQKF